MFPIKGSRGISPIIAEILLISIVVTIVGVIAAYMLGTETAPERSVTLEVRLENTADASVVRVTLMHRGGPSIPDPTDSDEGLRVMGGWLLWDNQVPSDNWVLSDPAHGLGFAENMVGYLRHADANVSAGDELWITVTDLYTDKIVIDQRTYTVQEPY